MIKNNSKFSGDFCYQIHCVKNCSFDYSLKQQRRFDICYCEVLGEKAIQFSIFISLNKGFTMKKNHLKSF